MKITASLIILAIAFAGCTANSDGAEVIVAPDDQVGATDLIGLTVDDPAGPFSNHRILISGTVNREVQVEARAGPRFDAPFHVIAANGSFSMEFDFWPGATEFQIHARDLQTGESDVAVVTVNVLAKAQVRIDYGSASERETANDTVWVNLVDFGAQAQYDEQGAAHPSFVNVHDALATWEKQYGQVIEYGYSEDKQSFSISTIDGEGNPVSAAAPPWWCYSVDGDGSVKGITLERFKPDSIIFWRLGECQQTAMMGSAE
jgi:hypothetical protein